MLITDATYLQLLAVDWDSTPTLCYADCPDWHGCDCTSWDPAPRSSYSRSN